jgi:outer membrane receptor for ferrienterochelin and colicins
LQRPLVNHYPALFIQDVLTFNANHELLAGLRVEYNTLYRGVAIAPRIDYKWLNNTKTHAIRFGIGSGFRHPNIFVDDKYAFTGGRKIEVDDNIQTELSYGTHLCHTASFKTELATISLENRAYFNFIFNMIEPEIDFEENVVRYENEDEYGMNFGLNTTLEVEFKFPLRLYIGTNVLGNFALDIDEDEDGEEEVELRRLINSPIFNAVYGISYTLPKSGLRFDLNGYINSPMRMRTQENDYRPDYSPWYSVINFRINKTIRKGIDFYVGVHNLLDVRPMQPIIRGYDPFNRFAEDAATNPNRYRFDESYNYAPNQGIRAYAGLSWVF